MNKENIVFHALGVFVAKTMLHGIIHPDMQLENIGFRQNSDHPIVFLDFPNIKKVTLPDELDIETLHRFTESLFPLLDDLNNSFAHISYFRMGFITMGGVFTHTIFSNAINSGYSSSLFINSPHKVSSINIYSLVYRKPFNEMIREWQELPLEDITLAKIPSLSQYNYAPERRNTSLFNMYYVDILYFSRAYITLSLSRGGTQWLSTLYFHWGLAALHYNLPFSAFGLFKKCLATNPCYPDLIPICHEKINHIVQSKELSHELTEFINSNIKHDLFELLWILSDLDDMDCAPLNGPENNPML